MNRPDISIVIPVYNSATIFPELHRRLTGVLDATIDFHEIIAVVDGNDDGVADVIAHICQEDPRVKMIEFSRNFGHQAAVTAGLRFANGEMVIVMDDDLEDPPEVLPLLIEKSQAGFDVVYGIRRNRKISPFRRLMFYSFYRLRNILSSVKMPYDAGDFCLMRKPVVTALNSLPENNRYIRGLRTWVGFKQVGLEYDRDARYTGESTYNWASYVKLALDGILAFSYRPLYFISWLGGGIAVISFVLGLRLLVLTFIGSRPDIPGWTSLMVITTFLGGSQLLALGLIGQYIARIYDEVKNRPNFIIKRKIGIDE